VTGLTPKHAAFVREYLVDLNATQAAIRAGYAPGSAKQQGHRLLTDDDVSAAIAAGMQAKAQQTGITKAKVVAMALDGAERALASGNHNAYLRGVELLAKLHGHIVERRDVRVIRGLDDLTDDELAALKASALGTGARH
jgi:phage terminase small subunit